MGLGVKIIPNLHKQLTTKQSRMNCSIDSNTSIICYYGTTEKVAIKSCIGLFMSVE